MPKKWDVNEARDIVARIYDQIQEREPDENGQLYWSGLLVNGELTVKQVIHYITESDEYKGRFITGLPTDQAVEKCYEYAVVIAGLAIEARRKPLRREVHLVAQPVGFWGWDSVR